MITVLLVIVSLEIDIRSVVRKVLSCKSSIFLEGLFKHIEQPSSELGGPSRKMEDLQLKTFPTTDRMSISKETITSKTAIIVEKEENVIKWSFRGSRKIFSQARITAQRSRKKKDLEPCQEEGTSLNNKV